jgi:hypothetical protein
MDNLLCDAIYSIEISMQKGKKLVDALADIILQVTFLLLI